VAISSPLNPSAIAREDSIEPAKLGSFITGGTPLGEGVLATAANKIVGFQRGAAVSARPPDLGSIINTLSSNILTNVENRVQSINQNITQVVENRFGMYDKEFKERMNRVESSKPNNILSNFLSLYKQAIEYIQFLGNKKNVKTLGDNIKELQRVFTETFEVAKIIRQTIIKIVKQLSNLPTADSAGGGLNLDIKVPGGPLKRTLPRGVANIGRMALAGGAIAGATALGGKVVSGMMGVGEDVSAAPMQDQSSQISGPLMDRFNSILERFSIAIDNLISGSKKDSSGGGGGTVSSGSGASTSQAGGGAPSAPSTKPSAEGEGAKGPAGTATRALLDSIAMAEGTFDQKNQGYLTHFGFDQYAGKGFPSAHPDIVKRPKNSQYASAAFGRYQFMPSTWQGVGGGAMTPERQDAGAVKLTIMRLNAAGIKVKNEQELESLLQKEGISVRIAAALAPEWASFPKASGSSYYGQPVKKLKNIQDFYQKRINAQGQPGIGGPELTDKQIADYKAGKLRLEDAQKISQTVAQQPGANEPSKPLMVPINLGQQTQQESPTPAATPPPVLNQSGTKLRAVSSTNYDNFYTVHSRINFNIVE
jgi:muramidase (phage lysozyme)